MGAILRKKLNAKNKVIAIALNLMKSKIKENIIFIVKYANSICEKWYQYQTEPIAESKVPVR